TGRRRKLAGLGSPSCGTCRGVHRTHPGDRAMNATTFALGRELQRASTMPLARLFRAYLTEAKYESIRALRAPAFAIPFLLLPIVLYVLIGVFLIGSMSNGDSKIAVTMFVNFATFGVM